MWAMETESDTTTPAAGVGVARLTTHTPTEQGAAPATLTA
jgi:hypothetical protein